MRSIYRLTIRMRTMDSSLLVNDSSYHYQPLKCARSFRLLKSIIPNHSVDSRLQFSLEEHTLNDCAPYAALSYTWQVYEPECPKPVTISQTNDDSPFIICDGANVSISSNLHKALLVLCERLTEAYLWVDALCINQADISERNAQVAMMADIYSSANSVISWLGEEALDLVAYQYFENEVAPAMLTRISTHGIDSIKPSDKYDSEFWRTLVRHLWRHQATMCGNYCSHSMTENTFTEDGYSKN